MRAILVDRIGFKKDIIIDSFMPRISIVKPDGVDMFSVIAPEEYIGVVHADFFFERDFNDEYGERILVYREH